MNLESSLSGLDYVLKESAIVYSTAVTSFSVTNLTAIPLLLICLPKCGWGL